MHSVDFDLAVLGGGCAGLSLATRLAQRSLRVAVIEPRATPPSERSWSFWRMRSDPFEVCVRARWSRWRVSHNSATAHRASPSLRYETVCSSRFYELAYSVCSAAPNIDLRLGCEAYGAPSYLDRSAHWRIETSDGPLRARYLVDTRPPRAEPSYAQAFVGREVAFDRARVDDQCVELMSFRAPRRDRIDFIYLLPFSPDRALIEATSFAETPPSRAEFDQWLAEELAIRANGGRVDVLREEAGVIPMTVRAPRDHDAAIGPRAAFAGLRGGAARPSTGYAFQRIQAMADQIAARVLRGDSDIRSHLDGPANRFMDRLFLRVLRRRPEMAPALFLKMFAHAPQDRLERFLSGSSALRDRAAVISSLPPSPFLRELATP